MKKIILICLFVFISCEHFSVFEKTQENVFFFKNNRTIESQFSGQLSIATFNIQMGFCQNCTPFSGEIGGGYEELDRIVNLINSLDIDIVSLQEVGLDYDVSIIQNQIEYIANKTNMNYAYGMGIAVQYLRNPFVNGLLGNAILSKYEIIDLENPRIRFIDYYVQNHCLKATIKLDEEVMVSEFTIDDVASSEAIGKVTGRKKFKSLQISNSWECDNAYSAGCPRPPPAGIFLRLVENEMFGYDHSIQPEVESADYPSHKKM